MDLRIPVSCPRCHKPMATSTIELHPTIPNRALQDWHCAQCGPVRTRVLSLMPGQSIEIETRQVATR